MLVDPEEELEHDEGVDHLLTKRLPATVRACAKPLHCDAGPRASRANASQITGEDMHKMVHYLYRLRRPLHACNFTKGRLQSYIGAYLPSMGMQLCVSPGVAFCCTRIITMLAFEEATQVTISRPVHAHRRPMHRKGTPDPLL